MTHIPTLLLHCYLGVYRNGRFGRTAVVKDAFDVSHKTVVSSVGDRMESRRISNRLGRHLLEESDGRDLLVLSAGGAVEEEL